MIITIPSKIGLINEDTDTIQVVIKFTADIPSDITYTPDEANITVEKLGDLDLDFDLEDLLLVPAMLSIELFDGNDIVGNLISNAEPEFVPLGGWSPDKILKNPEVTLFVNGVEEYIGKTKIENIRYNEGLKKILRL